MELVYLHSIQESKDYWEELQPKLPNSIFSKYEFYEKLYYLLLNKESLGIIDQKHYHTPLILIGIDKEVVGILPCIMQDTNFRPIYNIGIFGIKLPILPEYLHIFLEMSEKTTVLYDLSSFYLDKNAFYSQYYYWVPSTIIDLRTLNTIEEYISSLTKKKRQNLKKVISLNDSISISYEEPKNYKQLQQDYDKHWILTRGVSISLRMAVYDLMFEQSNVQIITLYDKEGKVIAVNKSLIDNETLLDYICIRSYFEESYIGLYAVYKNIELAIKNKISYYDLATTLESNESLKGKKLSYKKGFVNQSNIFTPCGYSKGKVEVVSPPYFDGKQWIF